MKGKLFLLSVAAGLCFTTLSFGDIIETADGARLVGKITSINEQVVVLETAYAGTIKINQDRVSSITTDEELTVRLESGTVISGVLEQGPDGAITIASSDGRLETSPSGVASAWQPSDQDPRIAAELSAIESQLRKWKYEAGVDLSASYGNTESSNYGVRASATLEGPRDRLRFYTTLNRAEAETSNGVTEKTAEEYIGGVSYTSFFSGNLGWYLREEIEVDEFEQIDFRSTSAGGLTYRFKDQPNIRLEGRAGLSYRHEDYTGDIASEGYPGLEFGVLLYWHPVAWLDWNTDIAYMPAFEDLGIYRISHKTTLDVPLAISDAWKLRLGVTNDYNSDPLPGLKELDTTYFVSLLLNWE